MFTGACGMFAFLSHYMVLFFIGNEKWSLWCGKSASVLIQPSTMMNIDPSCRLDQNTNYRNQICCYIPLWLQTRLRKVTHERILHLEIQAESSTCSQSYMTWMRIPSPIVQFNCSHQSQPSASLWPVLEPVKLKFSPSSVLINLQDLKIQCSNRRINIVT